MRLLASKDFFVTAFLNVQEEASWKATARLLSSGRAYLRSSATTISAPPSARFWPSCVHRTGRLPQPSEPITWFDSHFCTPGKGNEKGGVENLVGYVRRNFLVPVPEVQSDELNQYLRQGCIRNRLRQHPVEPRTIGTIRAEEQKVLLPLPPRPFDCARLEHVRANSLSLVHLDTNRYSVPTRYAYQIVLAKLYVDRVCLYHEGTLIAEHPRLTGRNRKACSSSTTWRYWSESPLPWRTPGP